MTPSTNMNGIRYSLLERIGNTPPRRPQRKHSRSAIPLPAPAPDHGYGPPRRHFDALPSRSSGT